MAFRIENLQRWWVLLLWFLALPCAWAADEVSVTARLSADSVNVGERVVLELTVQGSGRAGEPPTVAVDGVDVRYFGSQKRFESRNFSVSQSVIYQYALVPVKPGAFTIPAITVYVDGKPYASRPLTLVAGGNGGQTGGDGAAGKLAFAEWVLPKTEAYVGESVPAELRLYVASEIRWGLQQYPVVEGDGFTVQKLPEEPGRKTVTRDGRRYDLLVFETSITPVKTGEITLEPTEFSVIAEIRQPRNRSRSNDFFDDPFFDNFFSTARREQIAIHTDALTLKVNPLPEEGKPAGFSGAIGQFTFETEASPLKLRAGDPVTLRAKVSGIGNFERMGPPRVADEPGWRSYPPSSRFEKSDEAGHSGTKTFEMALIPEAGKEKLPGVEFSYFDPSKAKYVTLHGKPITVAVEGTLVPSPTPALANAPSPSPSAAQPAPAGGDELLFIRTDAGTRRSAFGPAWRQPLFWWSQLLPLAALTGFAFWKVRRYRMSDSRARRVAALQRLRCDAERVVNHRATPAGEFYDAAVRRFQIEAALAPALLAAAREPETLDVEAVCRVHPLDEETAAELRQLFAAHDRLRYAGGGAGEGQPVTPEERARVETLFQRFVRHV
ncbi:MAG TPA: BatD family protein [Chthoniobacteraceae bacterium]|nr:BatD family protein [Chthoniobacteraceae bacterium]